MVTIKYINILYLLKNKLMWRKLRSTNTIQPVILIHNIPESSNEFHQEKFINMHKI